METIGPQARFRLRREAHARIVKAAKVFGPDRVAGRLTVARATVAMWVTGATWPNGNTAARILEMYDATGKEIA
jgi:hypothetical protein